MSNPFAGTWTYRSFHNHPHKVQSFDELRLAQAELELVEKGPNWLEGKLIFGTSYIDMIGVGTFADGRWTLRMRGQNFDRDSGVPTNRDGNTKGWIYDYVGEIAADWPTGDNQRPAIVGTVIRSVFHTTDRAADHSYSFVAVRRVPDLPAVKPLPPSVVSHFADREHRLHHAVWHDLRNRWKHFPSSKQTAIAALGWEPPRPARLSTTTADMLKPLVTNGSGEDFLYFHREMVIMFRNLMAAAGETPIEWGTIPQPGTAGDEVPPAWATPESPTFQRRLRALKTDEFYWSRMRWWDQQFKDPTYLATLTLGEFGSLIEYSVHNDMHIRWSAPPRHPETNTLSSFGRTAADTAEVWDNPKYDWLGEFYSSHVNPFFWRLHGWIDDRINDWFEAHAERTPSQIETFERDGIVWFQPGGRWVSVEKPWVWPDDLMGGGGHHHGHQGHSGHGGGDPALRDKRIASLGKVLDIIHDRTSAPAAAARGLPHTTEEHRLTSHIFGE